MFGQRVPLGHSKDLFPTPFVATVGSHNFYSPGNLSLTERSREFLNIEKSTEPHALNTKHSELTPAS